MTIVSELARVAAILAFSMVIVSAVTLAALWSVAWLVGGVG